MYVVTIQLHNGPRLHVPCGTLTEARRVHEDAFAAGHAVRLAGPGNPAARIAAECLATADALRFVAVAVDRLERAHHPVVFGSEAATVVHCSAPIVAKALGDLAEALSR